AATTRTPGATGGGTVTTAPPGAAASRPPASRPAPNSRVASVVPKLGPSRRKHTGSGQPARLPVPAHRSRNRKHRAIIVSYLDWRGEPKDDDQAHNDQVLAPLSPAFRRSSSAPSLTIVSPWASVHVGGSHLPARPRMIFSGTRRSPPRFLQGRRHDRLEVGEMPQLSVCALLDLADPLLADSQVPADLVEGMLRDAADPVAEFEDAALAAVETAEESLDHRAASVLGLFP